MTKGQGMSNSNLRIYPLIDGYELSNEFKVQVDGYNLPIYNVKIASENQTIKRNAVFDLKNNEEYYENAAFGQFESGGQNKIIVTYKDKIETVKILPSYLNIIPFVKGRKITLNTSYSKKITIEINGDIVHSLHLFSDKLAIDSFDKKDKNVIYFGPGIHEMTHLNIGSNQTLYLAGGAVLRGLLDSINPNNNQFFIRANGDNIKIAGHGIIDMSKVLRKQASKKTMFVTGNNIKISDIFMIDPCGWNLNFDGAHYSQADNVKIFGYRANSDGIDIVNSSDMVIKNCFVRTSDDLIVLKTWASTFTDKNILVDSCVLWNPVGHALSIGAEVRGDVSNVLFENCEILHHTSTWWALRIFNSDMGNVSNVTFKNIRVDDSNKYISVWIGKNNWTRNLKQGTVNDVSFDNIQGFGKKLSIDLQGASINNGIDNIKFSNVKWNNELIGDSSFINKNQFVKDLEIKN